LKEKIILVFENIKKARDEAIEKMKLYKQTKYDLTVFDKKII